MRHTYLGYDPKTGAHRKNPLTPEESAFLGVIWVDHVGKKNCIPADDLARQYALRTEETGKPLESVKRKIRDIQTHLIIKHNLPVYSRAGWGGGYYINEGEADAEEFYGAFKSRGLTGFTKATRGKKSAMIDGVTQLSFQWEEHVAREGMRAEPGDNVNAPVEIVDAFLQKMLKDPEKFADGIRLLSEKYGSVLVPRKRFDQIVGALKSQAAELSNLVSSLEA